MDRKQFEKLDDAGKCAAWDKMRPWQKDICRDMTGLHWALVGLEGWRVELVYGGGWKERGIVSRSTGWKPCHIMLARRDSSGGGGVSPASSFTLRKLYKVR
jgi:hypothetical protein